jgi:hypothetical protein
LFTIGVDGASHAGLWWFAAHMNWITFVTNERTATVRIGWTKWIRKLNSLSGNQSKPLRTMERPS